MINKESPEYRAVKELLIGFLIIAAIMIALHSG